MALTQGITVYPGNQDVFRSWRSRRLQFMTIGAEAFLGNQFRLEGTMPLRLRTPDGQGARGGILLITIVQAVDTL
jgi:hypothetical protein